MADVERRRDPLDIAVSALQHRDRASADVDARLERAGIGEEERRATIESLERLGYIDDTRFAETRARALAGREQGDQAIRFDLERQGVGADELEQALASLTPERERAEAIVAARGGGATTARYLARKGFGEDGIAVAVAQEP
jgi:regulatory protein